MNRYTFFAKTRNQRRKRKSRRASKRSSRRARGGGWGYNIPNNAVVGRTNDEGVQIFKTMKEVRNEKESGPL
jgi:hypothetical protein